MVTQIVLQFYDFYMFDSIRKCSPWSHMNIRLIVRIYLLVFANVRGNNTLLFAWLFVYIQQYSQCSQIYLRLYSLIYSPVFVNVRGMLICLRNVRGMFANLFANVRGIICNVFRMFAWLFSKVNLSFLEKFYIIVEFWKWECVIFFCFQKVLLYFL